ncbi:neurogenic locus protein delta [Tetranychus urticae]|uniref:neurogenic locus protein delta n=1 Tax=Tetranychus urticae TaxID=32264 RepID=UPI00077BEBCA|nr:neurogenic locus protein delta [Tetranychus urticae]
MVRGFQADFKSKQQPLSSANRTSSTEPNPLLQKVILLVEVWHKSNAGHDKLITRHLELRNTTLQLLPLEDDTIWEIGGPNYSSPNTTSGIKFRYRWRITGSLKYSSADNNDNNNVIPDCPPGFRGDDCNSPICKTGCHSTHGYCNEPNECKCKFGWTGEFCSLCVPMPGCIHGSCSKPFECRCEEGWSGMFCDKPTCKPGCHPQNGYCEHPGECRCRFGYRGDNCTECATMPGCQNGDCENPLDCNCFKGWTGLFCNIPICSEGCDLEHGWCRRPNECRCRVGWSGSNCSECVPYPGCKMGNCTQPWTCDCQPGWGGIDCSEKLDYCELNDNPCLNGGTCISVEKNDGNFICRCNLGFEGKRCERTK